MPFSRCLSADAFQPLSSQVKAKQLHDTTKAISAKLAAGVSGDGRREGEEEVEGETGGGSEVGKLKGFERCIEGGDEQ